MTTTLSVGAGIAKAAEGLFARQRPDGSWEGFLPSSAVSTGSVIIALRVADPDASRELVAAGASWLRSHQLADGGWGDTPEAPASLNATAIAVAALRLTDAAASEEAVAAGLARIEGFGGWDAVADRRRCTLKAVCEQYLALAGLYPAERVGRMPFELALASSWLRRKLSFTVPGLMSWGVMQSRTQRFGPLRRAVNRLAEPRALDYLADLHDHEGPDGAVEESALMASVVCLGLASAGAAPGIVADYLRYLRGTVRPDGAWPVDRDIEFSVSMYLTHGLVDAGFGDDPRLRRTGEWIRASQRSRPFAPTGCPAGGWGWSLPSGWPDTDDTSCAVASLAALGAGADDSSLRRGTAWLLTMQNSDGSWGCFARNAKVSMDAPCSVMTSHAVLALHAAAGPPPAHGLGDDFAAPLARAVRWFGKAQRADGSYPCIWFRDSTAGTARVLDALGRLGLGGTPTATRALTWLLGHQRSDGGWGDGGSQPSSAEETAWAVLGLVSAGHADHPATGAGVRWLLDHQRADGLWDATRLGVYFLGLTYWCDHIADGYALQALGRYRAATKE
ncbi:prenyltransferase/squalene oxidase repeat-containing protein [Sphaerisporangium rubeum]|uniref:Squalene-hopene/tetraprenyl-beta-curcumene cyclase n=1 Tax=Sphaerisporangium rubeum TaxID=321317 RepID=A0A7X0M9R3_9ACTN|nr:squalene-hopene/tetraprenyl-beta-curcumene cyclase [Sphaerisporangium rubeum]